MCIHVDNFEIISGLELCLGKRSGCFYVEVVIRYCSCITTYYSLNLETAFMIFPFDTFPLYVYVFAVCKISFRTLHFSLYP